MERLENGCMSKKNLPCNKETQMESGKGMQDGLTSYGKG